MALTIEKTINLTTDPNNIAPLLVNTPYMCEEPDASLYTYFTQTDSAQMADKRTQITMGQYDDLIWAELQHHLTTRAVSRIGVKHFPLIGAIGFYKDKYTGVSNILAPVHAEQDLYGPPIIALSVSTETVQVTLTPPEDITYTCYRVIMRNDFFANEYVVYELVSVLPLPNVIGTYDVYVVGYNEETGILSEQSNIETLTISTGKSNWTPDPLLVQTSLSGLLDVSIVDLLNNQMIKYNTTSGKWENAAIPTSEAGGAAAESIWGGL